MKSHDSPHRAIIKRCAGLATQIIIRCLSAGKENLNVAQTDLSISVRLGSSLGHRCLDDDDVFTLRKTAVCMFLSQFPALMRKILGLAHCEASSVRLCDSLCTATLVNRDWRELQELQELQEAAQALHTGCARLGRRARHVSSHRC